MNSAENPNKAPDESAQPPVDENTEALEQSKDLGNLPQTPPEEKQSVKTVRLKPKVSLWERLNTPIYLRRYYQSWMLPLFSLALIGALIYGFWKLSPSNPAAIEPPPKSDETIELRFFGVELRGRKEGTPFFTILADKVDVSRDQRYVTFLKEAQKPHGEFFNLKDWELEENGEGSGEPPQRRSILWESDTAIYDFTMEKLTMQEQVKITTDLDDLILTDEMIWSKKDDTLESSTRSKITTHHKTYMESDRLKVETKEKTLFLDGKVFIEMRLGKDQRIDVEKSFNN